ncbi:MAG: hypothetical protein ACHREM_01390 [Polyangiales bacterium]
MNHWRNIALVLIGIIVGACVRSVAPGVAVAQTVAHHCDYTYIQDTGGPDIGENGEVTYDRNWGWVVSQGWVLKAVSGPTNANYVFERCQ